MKKRILIFGVLLTLFFSGCAQTSDNDPIIDESNTKTSQSTSANETTQTPETADVNDAVETETTEALPESTPFEIDWDSVNTQQPDITLPDDFFLHYMDDIYVNLDTYLNKVVAGQGYLLYLDENGESFAFVRDYICCGPDAYPVGILCTYDGKLLNDGTWVEVVGVIGKEKNQFTETPVMHIVEMKKAKEGPDQRLVDY